MRSGGIGPNGLSKTSLLTKQWVIGTGIYGVASKKYKDTRWDAFEKNGRGGEIRTPDLLNPIQAR